MAQARRSGAGRGRQGSASKRIYRKKPRQARSRTTVDAILDAAARILVRTGYERFTTNHVARLAGVSVGSLYQYFPSKEALIAALLDRHVDGCSAHILAGMRRLSSPSLDDVVRCLIESMVDAHRDDPELHRVFVEQLPRRGAFVEKTGQRLEQAVARWRMYLAQQGAEIAPQNHELSAFIIVHVIDALTHAAVVSRPELLHDPEFTAELNALILGYLKRGETGETGDGPRFFGFGRATTASRPRQNRRT